MIEFDLNTTRLGFYHESLLKFMTLGDLTSKNWHLTLEMGLRK